MNAADDVFDNPVDETYAKEFLEDPRHHIVVALVDSIVIGFASAVHYIHPDKPPELWINEVGVAPAHQGKGVGKAIMNELLRMGKQLGCATAWVLTDKNNTAANGLYKSVGGRISNEEMVMYGFGAIRAIASKIGENHLKGEAMPKKALEAIEEHFSKEVDPRKDRTRDHKLIDIIAIAICAVPYFQLAR